MLEYFLTPTPFFVIFLNWNNYALTSSVTTVGLALVYGLVVQDLVRNPQST